MKLWKVEITRELETYCYVMAEDSKTAEAEAAELASIPDAWDWWDTPFDSTYARTVDAPAEEWEPVWSGGPNGEWKTWDEILESQKPPAPQVDPNQGKLL